MSSVVLRVKVAVLGPGAVGKTAHAAVPAPVPAQNHGTSGRRACAIEGTKATVELYLCDISGHGMFRDIVPRLLEA